MSDWDAFDVSAYMASFTDDELISAAKECADDLTRASKDEPESEWHESCFAGMLCYARELNARGLKMKPETIQ